MTDRLKQLIEEGYPVTREDIARLSPYVTSNIKRFGDYVLNVDAYMPSLEGAWTWEGPPFQPAVHESYGAWERTFPWTREYSRVKSNSWFTRFRLSPIFARISA